MPKIQFYEVHATTERTTHSSLPQTTVVPDDMSPEEIADAIDTAICKAWQKSLIENYPFQLGPCRRGEGADLVGLVTISPQHLVSLRTVMGELRPATTQEVAENTPPVMPELKPVKPIHTGRPPTDDGEGSPSGSQPV